MEFGKVPTFELDKIRFDLPEDDPRQNRSPRISGSVPMQLFFGAPVWTPKSWVGKFYPPKTRSADFLFHYARQVTAIELNTTHYHIPDAATLNRWVQQTPDGFRFCPKILNTISHDRALVDVEQLTDRFCSAMLQLRDRLGLTFLQLSPTFSPDRLPRLEKFLALLPQEFSIAVEVRHPAFFRQHQLTDELFDLLQTFNAATVITDVAGRRDVLHLSLPSSKVLIRFIGNDLHPSDYTRLDHWIDRIQEWQKQDHVREVYFFIHQPGDVHAPELIQYFCKKMQLPFAIDAACVHTEQGEQLDLFSK